MTRANVPLALRHKLFREAFITSTSLDGLMVMEIDGKKDRRDDHFYGDNPTFLNDFHTWGEDDNKNALPSYTIMGSSVSFSDIPRTADEACIEYGTQS
jgi:hypothetical protein